MKLPSDPALGAAGVAVFVVSTAFRDVYLGGVFQSVNVFVVLLVAFGIATGAGLGLAWCRGGSLEPLFRAPIDVLMMNLTTAGAWICYFFALKFLDPSIVAPVFFNQIGMAKISPLSARIITAFGPALIFILQQADARIVWSTESFVAIAAYSVMVAAANVSEGITHRRRISGKPRVSGNTTGPAVR